MFTWSSMSKPCGWSVLLLVLLSFDVATTSVEGQLVTWNLANFSSSLPVVRNVVLLGDASIDNTTGPPRLVLNARGTLAGVATAGRALYSSQVQFKLDTTRSFASFTTNFTFAINDLGARTPAGCGGFTFQIRGDNSSVGESGEYLGLTTAASEGAASNSVFAVEFDTSQNVDVGDPSASHMGVDINGVRSTSTYNLCPSATNCTSLVNSGVYFTRIGYNGSQDSLQVELRYQNATTRIATWTVPNASLQPVFQDFMYVGFSGSNGVGCNQTHEILSWGFSTSRSLGSNSGSDGAQGPAAHVSYSCYKFNGCSNYRALVIGIPTAVGGGAIIFLIALFYCCCYRKKQSQAYAAVENDGKYEPASAKGADALVVRNPPDVEAPAAHKLPVPPQASASEVSLPLYKSTRGPNTADPKVADAKVVDPKVADLAPVAAIETALQWYKSKGEKTATDPKVLDAALIEAQPVAGAAGAALVAAASKAVEPKSVAPVAEPVNRNANDKVVMCCVQTKPKRDYKEPVVFSLKELMHATKSFSDKEVIGGMPGRRPVYRGVLRDNGAVVAIKEITLDNISNEFVEKAMVLGRIRHPNLVHLLGWCKVPDKGKLYLVYDYMPRGSLDKLLLLRNDEEGFLPFDARYHVLVGVGAGLTYLHEEWEQCVLHRDVKPSNVLLDAACNAHLGNFSHASLVDHNMVPESTIMDGTLGYMAPELPFTGKPSVKSDVFSFGILVLSVACGRLPLDWQAPQADRVLADSVWRAHSEGDLLRVVDNSLEKHSYSEQQMTTLLQVGLWCAHPDPSMRPTMALVWQTLIGRAKAPDLPATKPVVENYAALSSFGVMRSLGSRSIGDTVQPIRFPGMDQVS